MKKIYFALFVLFQIAFISVNAQELTPTTDGKKPINQKRNQAGLTVTSPRERCGFNLMMQKAKAKGFDENAFEAQINRLIEAKIAKGDQFTGPVTIPVIFHVIYRTADVLGNSSANLNTAKYQAQINQLNIDYANTAGTSWPGQAANVQIQFCMAVVDTAGRPLATPGIERINGQTKGWADLDPVTDAGAVMEKTL